METKARVCWLKTVIVCFYWAPGIRHKTYHSFRIVLFFSRIDDEEILESPEILE